MIKVLIVIGCLIIAVPIILFAFSWRHSPLYSPDIAIMVCPEYVHYYVDRGYNYQCSGHCKEAIDDYTKAIEISNRQLKIYGPSVDTDYSTELYNTRGQLYAKLGKYQMAIDDYNQALALGHNNPGFIEHYVLDLRGFAYSQLSQYQRAIEDFTAAISDTAHQAETDKKGAALYYYHRGEAYEKLGNKNMAARDKEKAEKLGYRQLSNR